MNADDLIAAFNELDDAETRIDRTKYGDVETVRLVPSWNVTAVRRFKALAADAAALFDPVGPANHLTRWLRFVLDHAPELVEDRYRGPGSLPYFSECNNDGTETCVPFIAQTLPNAASASALVVRRLRGHEARSDEPVSGLTVTRAARKMVSEGIVDGLTLKNARSRISRACNDGKIEHTGKGPDRRIDRDSLSTWLLGVRDVELERDNQAR